jgi:hypothetical protein
MGGESYLLFHSMAHTGSLMLVLLLFCGIMNAERAFTRILEPEIMH